MPGQTLEGEDETLPALPNHQSQENLIEFESALRVLNNLVLVQNPCLRKTMNMGPKKFNGTVPNSQVHQHTNKKITYTDFDTFTRIQSAQNASAATSATCFHGNGTDSHKQGNESKKTWYTVPVNETKSTWYNQLRPLNVTS